MMFRSALSIHHGDASTLKYRLGILPFLAYHHILIAWLAISIILFCKFALPTVIIQRSGRTVCMGRRLFEGEKCLTGRERHIEY